MMPDLLAMLATIALAAALILCVPALRGDGEFNEAGD